MSKLRATFQLNQNSGQVLPESSQSEEASQIVAHNAIQDTLFEARHLARVVLCVRFVSVYKVVKSIEILLIFCPSMSHFTMIRKHTEAFCRLRGFRLRGKLIIQLKAFRSLLSRR